MTVAHLLHLRALVRQRFQQLANAALQDGMAYVRRDLGQRLQHEPALVHGGMRDCKMRRADDGIAKQQNVNVDIARALGLDAPASHLPLDGHNFRQEEFRHQLGAQSDGAIQEPGLRGKLNRLGFEEGGDGGHLTEFAELADRGAEVGLAIADIRTQREIDGLLHGFILKCSSAFGHRFFPSTNAERRYHLLGLVTPWGDSNHCEACGAGLK